MPDDDKLTPAARRDVETCLSLSLTSGRQLARSQAAEVTARVVAERLVAHLEESGFVIMRKPDASAPPPIRPEGWPHTKLDDWGACFWAALFAARAVMEVTALREALCLTHESQRDWAARSF
jgi:hypothetical protein